MFSREGSALLPFQSARPASVLAQAEAPEQRAFWEERRLRLTQ